MNLHYITTQDVLQPLRIIVTTIVELLPKLANICLLLLLVRPKERNEEMALWSADCKIWEC